ncbi:MAG TPA: hemolysin family protein [Bacilli bacterium]|nr:hemolysin family protein [Bacilli bacterium]
MSPLRYINLSFFNLEGIKDVNFLLLAIIAVLIILSAFFSASETAYSSVNTIRLKSYVEEKRKGARKALYIADHFDKTLSTILVGNNFVNIAATTLAAFILTKTITDPTFANIINTILMTIIVLIFGEIVPKSYAKEHSERFALRFASIMYFTIKIMTPFTFLFIKIKGALLRHVDENNEPTVTEDELDKIIETMEEEGVIESKDAYLIHGVLDLGDRTVYDIMTPRVDMIAIELNESVESIKNKFFEHQFSRMPVFEGDKDHIVGFIIERDFYSTLVKGKKVDIKKMMKEPVFVSEEMKVDDLIRFMQSRKKHFAIVSDEYGGTSGIVTMEDAFEELVGEIYDEHDIDEVSEEIKKIDEFTYEVEADIDLNDLFEQLDLGEAPDNYYSTLGGFLYGLSESIPEENQEFTYNALVYRQNKENLMTEVNVSMHFKILNVSERRIKRVLVTIANQTDLREIEA